jgi:hypothetical protein
MFSKNSLIYTIPSNGRKSALYGKIIDEDGDKFTAELVDGSVISFCGEGREYINGNVWEDTQPTVRPATDAENRYFIGGPLVFLSGFITPLQLHAIYVASDSDSPLGESLKCLTTIPDPVEVINRIILQIDDEYPEEQIALKLLELAASLLTRK